MGEEVRGAGAFVEVDNVVGGVDLEDFAINMRVSGDVLRFGSTNLCCWKWEDFQGMKVMKTSCVHHM